MALFEDFYEVERRHRQEYERARARAMTQIAYSPIRPSDDAFMEEMMGRPFGRSSSASSSKSPDVQFKQLKKSVKQIEAEPFEHDARKRIEDKVNRLQNAGATAQALVLEAELRTRDSLVRLKEWDYKLLTKQTIEKFQKDNTMTATRDGLKLHIDTLDKYCGNPQAGEAKDRIIPDNVLEKVEEAQERELFDEFAVLWAEKVKDPLVLGIVEGCEDYFLIAEWGDDISFDQITKGE